MSFFLGYTRDMLLVTAVLSTAVLPAALACDLSLFSIIPTPTIPEGEERGFGWARHEYRGVALVGGRVATMSGFSIDQWKKVLLDPGRQDEWQSERFGNKLTEVFDASHLYMRLDLSFLMGAFRIEKQVVAEFKNYERPNGYRSCWQVVDPTPHLGTVAAWNNQAEWERDTYGCWDLTRAGAATLVSYQWWTSASAIPSAVQKYVLMNTLPDMVDAFDSEVAKAAAR